MRTRSLGLLGEQLAQRYLEDHGHTVLSFHYHSRFGEIDIVTRHKDTIHFIEVKTRSTFFRPNQDNPLLHLLQLQQSALPEAAVDLKKQQRFCRTVHSYCYQHSLLEASLQCDILSVFVDKESSQYCCYLLPSAFTCPL